MTGELKVPFITRWSGEREVSRADLCLSRKGLFYRHDDAADRDKFGALWARTVGRAGVGEPRFRDVSFSRQRQAMRDLLCQVCAGPASTTRLGTLFLLEGTVRSAAELEEEPTGQPPLCLPCARLSREQCPRLVRRYTAVRAKKPTVWGVFGVPYLPPTPFLPAMGGLVPEPRTLQVGYGRADLRFVLAHQLLRQLRRVTVIDLDAELAAQGTGQ
ncbi:hypothetical protein ACFV0C_33455 [Streptomyces sp. NPDC059568]|uniref:hypothetical protein n=1 Tax=Streptomyces sp. NPDC059568 TaxID=3346868 RepID=UPI0036CE675F